MSKILKLAVALVLVLLTSFPATAASQSHEVTIEVENIFGQDAFFFAHGPAVDAGLICTNGMVYDARLIVAGPPDADRLNFHVTKQFVCDDGSGEFFINLMAHVVFDPYNNTGPWNILTGSGAYATLHGRGMLKGTPIEGGVYDVYTGWVSVK